MKKRMVVRGVEGLGITRNYWSEPARDEALADNHNPNPDFCWKIPAKPTANPTQSPQSTGANKALSYKE